MPHIIFLMETAAILRKVLGQLRDMHMLRVSFTSSTREFPKILGTWFVCDPTGANGMGRGVVGIG